jgi:hypothetical protein
VNASEPLMMPRYVEPRTMEATPGCRDYAVEKRLAATGDSVPVAGASPSPELRGHPPRSNLVRVERDNPVRVRAPGGVPVGRP